MAKKAPLKNAPSKQPGKKSGTGRGNNPPAKPAKPSPKKK